MKMQARSLEVGTLIGGFVAAAAIVALLVAAPARALQSGCTQSGATVTCTYLSDVNAFVVPDGVSTVHVVAVGGKGGNSGQTEIGALGGLGARVAGDLSVTSGEALFAVVGGNGLLGEAGANGGGQPTPASPRAAEAAARPTSARRDLICRRDWSSRAAAAEAGAATAWMAPTMPVRVALAETRATTALPDTTSHMPITTTSPRPAAPAVPREDRVQAGPVGRAAPRVAERRPRTAARATTVCSVRAAGAALCRRRVPRSAMTAGAAAAAASTAAVAGEAAASTPSGSTSLPAAAVEAARAWCQAAARSRRTRRASPR